MRVTHQLLNDPLHQGGEGHAVIFSVVVNVFDQLGDDLRIRLGLKLVTLADLARMRENCLMLWLIKHAMCELL